MDAPQADPDMCLGDSYHIFVVVIFIVLHSTYTELLKKRIWRFLCSWPWSQEFQSNSVQVLCNTMVILSKTKSWFTSTQILLYKLNPEKALNIQVIQSLIYHRVQTSNCSYRQKLKQKHISDESFCRNSFLSFCWAYCYEAQRLRPNELSKNKL